MQKMGLNGPDGGQKEREDGGKNRGGKANRSRGGRQEAGGEQRRSCVRGGKQGEKLEWGGGHGGFGGKGT